MICGLVCHGIGIAMSLVSTFSDALKTAVQNGFEDGIETYGLISGLWTSICKYLVKIEITMTKVHRIF